MKDVRPVLMDHHAGFIVIVVGVPADMGTLVADQDALAGMGREPFRHSGAGKAGAYYQIIEHNNTSKRRPTARRRDAPAVAWRGQEPARRPVSATARFCSTCDPRTCRAGTNPLWHVALALRLRGTARRPAQTPAPRRRS